MTSHDACTSGASRVLTVALLQRLKMETLIPAPANSEMRSVIKFLNAQSKVPIEIHRQLCLQYFTQISRSLLHGPPVVQKIVRQVGAKATYTRTQSNEHGVSIGNCGPPFLSPQEIPVRSASKFSEWQSGGDECQSNSNPRRQTSMTQEYKRWSHSMTNFSIPEVICWKIAQHLLYLIQ